MCINLCLHAVHDCSVVLALISSVLFPSPVFARIRSGDYVGWTAFEETCQQEIPRQFRAAASFCVRLSAYPACQADSGCAIFDQTSKSQTGLSI